VSLETQVEFARRLGVDKSTVTRWKVAGRLVLQDGMVDVEESLAIIEHTKGPRDDVGMRNKEQAQQRATLAEIAPPDPENTRDALRRAALEKAQSDARIKKAEADIREMERDRQMGILMLVEDVNYVLDDFGALLRSLIDGRAERLGAELGLTSDQIVSISEADERLLAEMAEKLNARVKR